MSFHYIARPDARALILGSMPSLASVSAGMYYAHPRNAFWRIMADLWDAPPLLDAPSRAAFIQEKRAALWDCARECSRVGSADHTIRDVLPNDLSELLVACPGIRRIFLNGTKAGELFERYTLRTLPLERADIPWTLLPSTSPANTMPYQAKLAAWRVVREITDNH